MNRSFKLVTVFNIPIEINYTWFLVFGLVIFTLAKGYFPADDPGLPDSVHWFMAIVAALFFFASLLAHELAHSLVAIRNGLAINGITLFVFGGVAHLEEEPSSPWVELKMALAGPALSFGLSFFFFALTQTFLSLGVPSVILSITNYLFIINFMVGLFNLIPGFPLDGGRVLRASLWACTKDLKKATRIASALGKGFAYFLIAAGLYLLFKEKTIFGIWYIFIGLFLQEAAGSSYQRLMLQRSLTGVRTSEIMSRDVVSVPASLPLDKLLDDYFFRYRFAAFPVVDDDNILGLVTFHSVKEIDRNKWPLLTAREAMIPLSGQMTISESTELISAMAKMAGNGLGRLLVIDGAKLIGIISQRDIMRLFELKSELDLKE